jgi:hypothetical protein
MGNRRGLRFAWALLIGLISLGSAAMALPGDGFDDEPINYTQSEATDLVARLQKQLDRGHLLQRNNENGYLQAVLRELNIPVSSQTLVFSKTSLQTSRISPLSPRAIYFNDDVYVGWIPSSMVLEISAADPQLGATFYTLNQDRFATQKFVRQNFECLSCHSSGLTGGVPGHTVRSVFTTRDGQPFFSAGSYVTTDESPMSERYGGWYVTGTNGEQHHLGNLLLKNEAEALTVDRSAGANITTLHRFFDPSAYLSPHSDLVALTVLQHQTHLHNVITKANHETRKALLYEKLINKELGRGANFRSEGTTSRIRSVAEPLVRGLLFSGEAPLTGPISGTSTFVKEFEARGPFSAEKRSLRQFDLKKRLFRNPCSYLIYSESFAGLPAEVKDYVYRRFSEILSGKDATKEFAHLNIVERQSILQILRDTKPDFSAWLTKQARGGA